MNREPYTWLKRALLILALAVGLPRAGSAVPTDGPTVVSGVAINAQGEGGTVVEVLTTRPATYRILHLHRPHRVVVDIEQARLGSHRRIYPAQSPVLKGVRLGQFRSSGPAVVRVVADLAGNPKFDIHPAPRGVRIELTPRIRLPQSVSLDKPMASGTRPQKPETSSSQPLTSARLRGTGSLHPEFENVLPAATGSKGVPAAPRQEIPAGTPESLRAARAARIVAANAGATALSRQEQNPPAPETPPQQPPAEQPPAQQPPAEQPPAQPPPPQPEPQQPPAQQPPAPETPAQPTPGQQPAAPPALAPPAPTPAVAPQEKPKYTGEPISLNLKDVDLKDFFRLIHEISGLNIIVDPNVLGSVTLVLDSVPWDQALDIVLKNNRLDKTLEGNVLRIARMETLAAEEESAKKLTEAREESQPLVSVFRPVNYAKASEIAAMLKSWVGGGALTKRGSVQVDTRANTLIISDIQSQIPIIEAIITKLDRKAKQVAIEARIVLATSSFSRSLQAALNGAITNVSTTTVGAGSTGTGAGVTGNVVPPPRITIQQTSASGFGAVAISNEAGRYIITAALAAAETKSLAKTISRPTIVTQNNVQGSVQQGSQIPIQTTINNTISIQYVNASLTLSVTPQVTEDGNIFMNININNASPGAVLTSAGPSINTQMATTQVLVPNGGSVLFGGVTVSARSRSATYVPLIGNIPIIGHLFKTSNVQDSDNELLFFVSPKILPG